MKIKMFLFQITFCIISLCLQNGCNRHSFPVGYEYGDINLTIEESQDGIFIILVYNTGKEAVFLPEFNAHYLVEYGFSRGYFIHVKSNDDKIWHHTNAKRLPRLTENDLIYLESGDHFEYTLDLRDIKLGKLVDNGRFIEKLSNQSGTYKLYLILSIHPNVDWLPRSEAILNELFIGETEVSIIFKYTAGESDGEKEKGKSAYAHDSTHPKMWCNSACALSPKRLILWENPSPTR